MTGFVQSSTTAPNKYKYRTRTPSWNHEHTLNTHTITFTIPSQEHPPPEMNTSMQNDTKLQGNGTNAMSDKAKAAMQPGNLLAHMHRGCSQGFVKVEEAFSKVSSFKVSAAEQQLLRFCGD